MNIFLLVTKYDFYFSSTSTTVFYTVLFSTQEKFSFSTSTCFQSIMIKHKRTLTNIL